MGSCAHDLGFKKAWTAYQGKPNLLSNYRKNLERLAALISQPAIKKMPFFWVTCHITRSNENYLSNNRLLVRLADHAAQEVLSRLPNVKFIDASEITLAATSLSVPRQWWKSHGPDMDSHYFETLCRTPNNMNTAHWQLLDERYLGQMSKFRTQMIFHHLCH